MPESEAQHITVNSATNPSVKLHLTRPADSDLVKVEIENASVAKFDRHELIIALRTIAEPT